MEKFRDGFFSVLIGADGSGKSSLIGHIRREAPEWKYVSASPSDLYPTPGLEYMNWALETHPREYVKHMRPLSRSLFFMKTLAVEYEYHIAPALASGSVVVCDSYYYRFLAKERLHNPTTRSLFDSLQKYLPPPDLILWLDLPLAAAYERKSTLSDFEVNDDRSKEGFIKFQRAVLENVREITVELPVIYLDATRPLCELTKTALHKLRHAITAHNVSLANPASGG